MSISIVIPSFNGRKLLEVNLPAAIAAVQMATDNWEVIVVDDASTDDTLAYLSAHFPAVRCIANKKNAGFSPTINRGIMAATKDLILLLNNDVLLTGDYFTPQLAYFNDPNTFGVMGTIIGLDNDRLQDTAKYPDCSWLRINGTMNYVLPKVVDFWRPSFILSGANALVDRRKIQKIGGFYEVYAPFYWEDVDLFIRAWRMGWSNYHEPKAVCRHPNSVTINRHNKPTTIQIIAKRNKIILHYLHLSDASLPFYFLKTGLKAFAWAVLGRITEAQSLWQFVQIFTQVKAAKEHFSELSSEIVGQSRSLRQVCLEIKSKIDTAKPVKF